jgi:hypothetical protein
MFGKGKMYKDSPAELLFPEFDEVPAEPVPEMPEIKETVQQSEEKLVSFDINTLIDTTQTIKNQRKVAKIIILFDDGSYQEM